MRNDTWFTPVPEYALGVPMCARDAPLLLLGGPLDGTVAAATAALHLRLQLDLIAGNLPGVAQLHFLVAELARDAEGYGVALHLTVGDGGLSHHAADGLAGELVAVLFKGEGALDGTVPEIGRRLPGSGNVRR